MAGSAFCSFIYMSHLIIHFIKKVRKEKKDFELIQQDINIGELLEKINY